jgi:hypothetical protein
MRFGLDPELAVLLLGQEERKFNLLRLARHGGLLLLSQLRSGGVGGNIGERAGAPQNGPDSASRCSLGWHDLGPFAHRPIIVRRDALSEALKGVSTKGTTGGDGLMPLEVRDRPRRHDFLDEEFDALQWVSLKYYLRETNRENGLVADKTAENWPSSITAVGMALATAPLVAERGLLPREEMARRVLTKLRFFHNCPQGTEPDATGYKGFYYHFLDMQTGRRAWQCELSTIDSTFLLAGALTSATYFDRDSADEAEIRELGDALYRRADWQWATDGGPTVTHGWTPERGFIPNRWTGYDESLLLYILALGSPTFPLPEESYAAYTATYHWKRICDQELLYSGPLFTHQLSHIWVDFRGIQDAYMKERGTDYFENSRRATYVQQAYATHNPFEFEGYGPNCWGITACDGPGWITMRVKGVERRFFDYYARGAPYGPDDGTIAPWAVVASPPFAPEIVRPTIAHFEKLDVHCFDDFGYRSSFNQTFPVEGTNCGWVSPYRFGIDQGPMALMIQNYRDGLIWNVMKRCPYVVNGLRRAGFVGGWL